VVAKGLPPVAGERALVDATYNANMPFKWNATRVQVLPSERQNFNSNLSGYNAVPPPQFNPAVSGKKLLLDSFQMAQSISIL